MKYNQFGSASSGTFGYKEDSSVEIKNVVSSSYFPQTGTFRKTTYISKIGIYDKDQNLIAIAKLDF